MSKAIESYLDTVLQYANLTDNGQTVRQELADHLEAKVNDLVAQGMARDDAVYEALQRHGDPKVVGYGLRPKFSLIDIRLRGTARGVIAIGPKAVGVFAFGGAAMGVFAFGGLAAGVFSIGGVALGLMFAFGIFGLGGCAVAGTGIGLVALAGTAIGGVAGGGLAAGLIVTHAGLGFGFYAGGAPAWLIALDEYLVNQGLVLEVMAWVVYAMLGAIVVSVVYHLVERRRAKVPAEWAIHE
jgi:hypothetical protein